MVWARRLIARKGSSGELPIHTKLGFAFFELSKTCTYFDSPSDFQKTPHFRNTVMSTKLCLDKTVFKDL